MHTSHISMHVSLFFKWDIVLHCLILASFHTHAASSAHATVPEPPTTKREKALTDSTNDKIFYLRVHSHRVLSWC